MNKIGHMGSVEITLSGLEYLGEALIQSPVLKSSLSTWISPTRKTGLGVAPGAAKYGIKYTYTHM